MDVFFIAVISFVGGVIIDRAIIVCRRRSAENNRNNKNEQNSPDNHDQEKRENVENSITEAKQEVKQDGQKNEIEKNKQMKFYDEIDHKLKILNKKADQALKEASKSEVLISNETNELD